MFDFLCLPKSVRKITPLSALQNRLQKRLIRPQCSENNLVSRQSEHLLKFQVLAVLTDLDLPFTSCERSDFFPPNCPFQSFSRLRSAFRSKLDSSPPRTTSSHARNPSPALCIKLRVACRLLRFRTQSSIDKGHDRSRALCLDLCWKALFSRLFFKSGIQRPVFSSAAEACP